MWVNFVVDVFVIPLVVWLGYMLYRLPGKPEIIFSKCIANKDISLNGKTYPEYTISYMNFGGRNLIECSRVVRLTVETRDTPGRLMKKAVSHLSMGDTNIVPLIHGIELSKPIVADIHIENMHEFKRKARYSPDISAKADAGTLRLDEILERYGDDKTDIEVHISGDDGRDGRMHFTKHYTFSDIYSGEFVPVASEDLKRLQGLHRKYLCRKLLFWKSERLLREAIDIISNVRA